MGGGRRFYHLQPPTGRKRKMIWRQYRVMIFAVKIGLCPPGVRMLMMLCLLKRAKPLLAKGRQMMFILTIRLEMSPPNGESSQVNCFAVPQPLNGPITENCSTRI